MLGITEHATSHNSDCVCHQVEKVLYGLTVRAMNQLNSALMPLKTTTES